MTMSIYTAATLTRIIQTSYPQAKIQPERNIGCDREEDVIDGLRVSLYIPTGHDSRIGNELYFRSMRDWELRKDELKTHRRVSR